MLRSIFGTSKATKWKNIADELGEHVTFQKEDFWSDSKLFLKHRNWEFLMSTRKSRSNDHSTTYTSMKVPFATSNNFRFHITQEGFFSTIGKYLNFHDIEINDTKFDNEFYIKGTDEELIKKLFIDDQLKKMMLRFKDMDLEVTADPGFWGENLPNGVLVLRYECIGVVDSVTEVDRIFSLLVRILDRLLEMGAILKYHPNFRLSK